MDSFLDTNVIFKHSNYTPDSDNVVKKCHVHILNKDNYFIICGAVLEEIDKIVKKRAAVHKAVISKISKPSILFEDLLHPKDVGFAKQLYEEYKNKDLKNVSVQFANERDLSEIAIQKFLKTGNIEKVIPVDEIDNELVSKIRDIIFNYDDCKILAGALQIQRPRKLFLFVTADGKDFAPNHYIFLKEHFKINHPKEGYIFPELLNFVFN